MRALLLRSLVNYHQYYADGELPTLTLRLKNDKKVQWTTETVDNEDMNKKKSKCCCIFNKPRQFDESSSEDSDDECDHCHGHVEKNKHRKTPRWKTGCFPTPVDSIPHSNDNHSENCPNPEPNIKIYINGAMDCILNLFYKCLKVCDFYYM